MEILNQYGESTLRDFKSSCMNHVKGSIVSQLTPVEHNRLKVSDYMVDTWIHEMLEYRNAAKNHLIALEKRHGMLPRRNNQGHDDKTEGLWNVSLFRNAHRDGGSIGEFVVEGFFRPSPEQAFASEYEKTCGAKTLEKDQQKSTILQEGAKAHEKIDGWNC